MKTSKPNWITPDTMIDTTTHPEAEAWIEEHENEVTGEKVFLSIDTSGSDYGLGIGIIGVFDSFEDASDAIGHEYGFNEFWKKF